MNLGFLIKRTVPNIQWSEHSDFTIRQTDTVQVYRVFLPSERGGWLVSRVLCSHSF